MTIQQMARLALLIPTAIVILNASIQLITTAKILAFVVVSRLLMQYVLDHKSELGLQQAYMMFCDQDDIWVKDKISIQVQAMLDAESNNPDLPILVHSDLQVVSHSGQLISESFMHYQGLSAERNAFSNLAG